MGGNQFILMRINTIEYVPLASFVKHYPRGIATMSKIKLTFRTETGKKYGPQFIDIGLAVGEKLIEIIKHEFQDDV